MTASQRGTARRGAAARTTDASRRRQSPQASPRGRAAQEAPRKKTTPRSPGGRAGSSSAKPAPRARSTRPASKGAAANRAPRGATARRAPKGARSSTAPKGVTPKRSSETEAKAETDEETPLVSRRAVKYGLALLVLAGAALMFMSPVRTVIDQGNQISAAHRQIQGLNAENNQLKQEIGALQTPADIEQIARQDYGLVQPGEQAYGVVPSAAQAKPPPPPPAPPPTTKP